MGDNDRGLLLISPGSKAHWDSYHDIRRRILFEARGRHGIYDDQHPDEFKPANHPKVLLLGDKVVGVIRIDLLDENAYLRRVAVDESYQGKGYGRTLIALSEHFILNQGRRVVMSNVAGDAVGFYKKCGYAVVDTASKSSGSVPMYKKLSSF